MKKVILTTLLVIACIFTANAQKFALIDMEYITKNIPEYQKATEQLNTLQEQYQKEIEALSKDAQNLYKQYQQTSSNLSASQRNQKEETIVNKEKEAQQLRQKYFGPEGEMTKKQEELISPIQNRIYETVKQLAQSHGYSIVFDRAAAQNMMIFASPKIDISDEVLSRLGYSK